MHQRLQPGMRENPASTRRHGSRPAVLNPSHATLIEDAAAAPPLQPVGQSPLLVEADSKPNAASPRAATGGEKEDAITTAAVAARTGSLEKPSHAFEPLIDSGEAARLLGDIHIKTLQRYARRGHIPGYQIGGHWYFRTSELDSWLRSQINSNCQPADRVDFTQEKP
jgi:excisionase family DNA binding protein